MTEEQQPLRIRLSASGECAGEHFLGPSTLDEARDFGKTHQMQNGPKPDGFEIEREDGTTLERWSLASDGWARINLVSRGASRS